MTKLKYRLSLLFLPLAVAACSGLPMVDSDGGPSQQQPELTPMATVRGEPLEARVFTLDREDQAVVGTPQIVYARHEDSFPQIARNYGLGYDELVAANPGIDPWLPGEGQPILLPTQFVLPNAPRDGLVLNIASKRLFYFPPAADDGSRTVITYPVGIGRVGWETPLGEAEVVAKARDPHWWVPASVRREHEAMGDPLPSVVPPGPDNPLGRHVLQLDMPGYLIHGTNQPYGVGMRVSHGCVRLYPEDIEALFPMVAIGAPVTIVNQPYLAGWHQDELYFEAHEPLADDEVSPAAHLDSMLAELTEGQSDGEVAQLRSNLESIASLGTGMPVRVMRNDVLEVYERATAVRNTVERDPDVPTLAEIRELLDSPPEAESAEAPSGSAVE